MQNPELFNPFGCYLLKHKVPDEIFNALSDEVDSVRDQLADENFVRENNFAEYLAGRNTYQIRLDDKLGYEKNIYSYVMSLGAYYLEQIGIRKDIRMGSIWINYGRKGDFNPIHTHDALLSGVMYMCQDDGITKEQEEGSHGRATSGIPGMTHFVHDLNHSPLNRFTYSNPFVKGELLMFPSFLTHWVNPFQTDGERVTIAFNILEA
jgi:uncharacterized protein (TIGR02466 family)